MRPGPALGTPVLAVVADVEEVETEVEEAAAEVVEAGALVEEVALPMCIPSWEVMEDTRFCISSGGGADPPVSGQVSRLEHSHAMEGQPDKCITHPDT